MSAVLKQAKQFYRKMLWLEMVILSIAFIVVIVVWDISHAMSVLLGGLSALIPQGFLVYWVFFRKYPSDVNKMSVFYRGEALKWFLTILLMIGVFRLFVDLEIIAFFSCYFVMLVCNSMFPLFLRRR